MHRAASERIPDARAPTLDPPSHPKGLFQFFWPYFLVAASIAIILYLIASAIQDAHGN